MDQEIRYAGLGIRFLALLADFVIFCAIFFPITKYVKGVWIMSAKDHQWSQGWFVTDPLCITFLFIMAAYFILLEGTMGSTIGELIVGIRVLFLEQGKPGLKAALIRNVLRIVDGLPALNILGIVSILRSEENARIGDFPAHCTARRVPVGLHVAWEVNDGERVRYLEVFSHLPNDGKRRGTDENQDTEPS